MFCISVYIHTCVDKIPELVYYNIGKHVKEHLEKLMTLNQINYNCVCGIKSPQTALWHCRNLGICELRSRYSKSRS